MKKEGGREPTLPLFLSSCNFDRFPISSAPSYVLAQYIGKMAIAQKWNIFCVTTWPYFNKPNMRNKKVSGMGYVSCSIKELFTI